MAYDERLAERIHALLESEECMTSKKMFGGVGFMVGGHMAVAAGSGGDLMVRVDPASSSAWVGGHVSLQEMQGREMAGWLSVASPALASDKDLKMWVDRGVDYVKSLPPKT